MGRPDVTEADLLATAHSMPTGATGRNGISSDVLIVWATKYHAGDLEVTQGVNRFKNFLELEAILADNQRTLFLLVNVVVKIGQYSHLICITREFLLFDSELAAPIPIQGQRDFASLFKRYTDIHAVYKVLDGPPITNKHAVSLTQCYDLTDM